MAKVEFIIPSVLNRGAGEKKISLEVATYMTHSRKFLTLWERILSEEYSILMANRVL